MKYKRVAPVLDRINWEKWFRMMEAWMLSKDADSLVEKTKKEYAWIFPHGEKPPGKLHLL